MLEQAWWHTVLKNADPKKFPKKPVLLWDPDHDRQTPVHMANIIFAMASNGAEFSKKFDIGKLN